MFAIRRRFAIKVTRRRGGEQRDSAFVLSCFVCTPGAHGAADGRRRRCKQSCLSRNCLCSVQTPWSLGLRPSASLFCVLRHLPWHRGFKGLPCVSVLLARGKAESSRSRGLGQCVRSSFDVRSHFRGTPNWKHFVYVVSDFGFRHYPRTEVGSYI